MAGSLRGVNEAEAINALRKLLYELHEADGRYPGLTEGDHGLRQALNGITFEEVGAEERDREAMARGEYVEQDPQRFAWQREQARRHAHDQSVVERENRKGWERRALEVRQLRKQLSDLRSFEEDGSMSADQRLELAQAERAERRAKVQLLLGVDRLTYPQGQALTYAERRQGADVVDDRLSDEKVGAALGSGPAPSGEGAAQLLTDAERREALFEPSPSG